MSFFGPSVRNGLPIGLGSIAGFGVQQFSPADLFAAGEQGFWYDPSDLTTLFQDSAGTTPVTAVEQAVGRMLDKSGRGNHAFQTTSAKRPVLRARYNLLTYSEQFDNGVWGKYFLSVNANAATAPNGTLTADKITATANNAQHYIANNSTKLATNQVYTWSFYAKKAEYNFVSCIISNQNGLAATAGASVAFDLVNGTTNSVTYFGSGWSSGTASIVSVGDGWYFCSLTATSDTSTFIGGAIYASNTYTTTPTFTGDGTSGVFIWGADLRPASQATGLIGPTYQRIAAATDYDVVGFAPYLAADGFDDAMTTNSIDPGAIDKAQVFAGVRKLSDAAAVVLAELSASSSGNNGAFGVFAPGTVAPDYYWRSRGTNSADAQYNNAAVAAPVTSVLTGIGDISGDISTLRVNGAQAATSATDQGTGNYGNYPLFIGARSGTSFYFTGWIYSLIGRFGSNLTAGQISATEQWVAGKSGVQL